MLVIPLLILRKDRLIYLVGVSRVVEWLVRFYISLLQFEIDILFCFGYIITTYKLSIGNENFIQF